MKRQITWTFAPGL